MDILCIQDHRREACIGGTEIQGRTKRWIYIGNEAPKGKYGRTQGVGFLVTPEIKEWIKHKMWVSSISERICSITFQPPGSGLISIIGVYMPVRDAPEEEKHKIWGGISALMESLPTARKIVLGDFNSTIEKENLHHELEYIDQISLAPRFKQKDKQTYTWKSGKGGVGRIIDHICYCSKRIKEVINCKIKTPHVITDHKLVKSKIWIRRYPLPTKENMPKIKLDNKVLKEDTVLEARIRESYENLREEMMKEEIQVKVPKMEQEWMKKKTWETSLKSAEAYQIAKKTRNYEEYHKINRKLKKLRNQDWDERLQKFVEELDTVKTPEAFFRATRPIYKESTKRDAIRMSREEASKWDDYFRSLLTTAQDINITPLPDPKMYEQETIPPQQETKEIENIYTDGSGLNQSEPSKCKAGGGVWFGENDKRNIGFRCNGPQTNNRGEISAFLVAISRSDPKKQCHIHTDSRVVIHGWYGIGRMADAGFPVPHDDLWKMIFEWRKHRDIIVSYVRGHTGIQGNEEADRLADKGARKKATTKLPKGTNPPENCINNCIPINDSIPNEEEIINAMKKVKSKSMGRDGIHSSVWKWALKIIDERDKAIKEKIEFNHEPLVYAEAENMKKYIVEYITKTFTEMKVTQHAKDAIIIALPKIAHATQPNQYRGITLLSHLSKVITNIILARSQGLPLLPNQYGFRPNRSTVHAIYVLKSIIHKAKQRGIHLWVTYFDVTKAYDSINREKLWNILKCVGFGPRILSIIRELYDDRVWVRVDGNTRDSFKSSVGLRQGCLLSPFLFNIALDYALKEAIKQLKPLQELNGLPNFIAYADDLATLADSRTNMQHQIDVMARALAMLGMKLSIEKTKWMLHVGKPQIIASAEGMDSWHQKMAKRASNIIECVFFERDNTLVIPWPDEVQNKGTVRAACPHEKCNFSTTYKESMRKHWKNIHNRKITVEKRRKTISTHTKPIFEELYCKKCDNRWNNLEKFRNHKCGTKNKGSWDYNKCDSCKWRFKSKKMLAEHSCQGPPKQFSATSIHNEAPKRYARENRPPPDTGPLFLYGDEIKQTNSFKYLGSTITEDAKDDVELKLRLNLASKIFYRLHRSLKGLLTLDKKLKLLNVVIMAILLYGSEAWILTEKQKNKLQAFHNKALRLITGKFPTIQRRADGIIIDITFPHYSSLLTTTESQDVIETWKDRVENFRARLTTLPKPDPVWSVSTIQISGPLCSRQPVLSDIVSPS